ncbi:hypothetical protein [Sphingomonas sp. CFBP 8760]|uniref:hypothetical protein n=1 Tax=Sphingomonas sp. CFBP 8760 TaxID=2775282 RepID=UPI00177C3B85|nr:hypothetical protein [Sphingomonas sp. CFBP 8760]MBD8546855.1 hypothetical protein [Sphingomonas sp. CFBP 8760]
MNGTQPTEQNDQIQIAIIDETYGVIEEDADWKIAREELRRTLEAEHGLPFEDGDIGPGASLPAFITFLSGTAPVPLWTMSAALFFLGKPIMENLTAWRDVASKLRAFLKRPVALNRHGAAIIAVEAVFDQMGGLPREVRLLSYGTRHVDDDEEIVDTGIAGATPTLFLGFIRHVFRIEADGVTFAVEVDGRIATTKRIDLEGIPSS